MLLADVVVVGAGPAGTAAAITLARAGRDVVVVDKATFPRDKCCGDGLTTLALRELDDLDFDAAAVASWAVVGEALLRAPSGRHVRLPLPVGAGTYAAVTPRLELDAALADLAVAAGAKLRAGHAFTGLTPGPAHVDVAVEDGESIRTRYVVAADGMWSPVRKALGLTPPGYLGEWHAFRQYVDGVSGPAADQLIVWFDDDFLPGYAWSFPLPGGRANVGFGVRRDGVRHGREMKAQFAGLLDRPHVRGALGPEAAWAGGPVAWPIPARIDHAPLAAGRVLLTGDAAMATDVLTGEGIGQALVTGRLAAEAIIGAGALNPSKVGRDYEQAVRNELVADHRMSAALGRALAHRRGADGALAVLARVGARGRGHFARWMFEDEPRAIALTPRRWHRKLFGRPGVPR